MFYFPVLLLFLYQVTVVGPQQQQQQQQTLLNDTNDSLLLAGASIEDKLRAVVRHKNIRIREFFRDFDPLRKGIITG